MTKNHMTKFQLPTIKEISASLRCEYCGAHGHKANKCPVKAMDKKCRNGIYSK